MPEITLEVDDSILEELKKHENIQKITDKMIEAASPIMVKSLKSELSKHSRTADLVKSVKATKVKRDKNDNSYAIIRPTGQSSVAATSKGRVYGRKVKVRNMEKLAWLEYGNSQGQKPTPVIKHACEKAHSDIIDTMSKIYEKETGI